MLRGLIERARVSGVDEISQILAGKDEFPGIPEQSVAHRARNLRFIA
jgi:hypothetical protein